MTMPTTKIFSNFPILNLVESSSAQCWCLYGNFFVLIHFKAGKKEGDFQGCTQNFLYIFACPHHSLPSTYWDKWCHGRIVVAVVIALMISRTGPLFSLFVSSVIFLLFVIFISFRLQFVHWWDVGFEWCAWYIEPFLLQMLQWIRGCLPSPTTAITRYGRGSSPVPKLCR